MTDLAQDIRYAFRTLARSSGFTAIAIVTLALGIGANTAIFSVVHSVLLKPLPYPDAERLIVVTERQQATGKQSVAWANFLDWRAESRAVEGLAAYRTTHVTLSRSGEPALLRAGDVSAAFFPLLGARAALGRVFAEADDRPGSHATVVLSDELWRARFGADPGVVGQTLRLDGAPRLIIGVLPPRFRFFPQPVDLYLPLGRHGDDPAWIERGNHQGLSVLGRLRAGVTLPQARAELDTIMERLEAEYPKSNSGQRTMVVPIFESQISDVRPTLWSLFGAVALILLLSCANVAHLFLARAATRKREFAIRAAIGASRARILRQLLTESVVLAVAAGGLGLLLGVWAIGPLLRIAPADIPRLSETGLNGAVLLFSLAASILTGILFGLAPAVAAFRSHPQATLKDSGPGATASPRGRRQRAWLFVGEVALAFLVVIGSGLLIRSLLSVRGVDPGFSAGHVLAMDIILPDARYGSNSEKRAFFAQSLEHLRALPGVAAASAVLCPPLMGPCWGSVYVLSDRPAPAQAELPSAVINVADPEYFRTLGIPLRRGRLFQPSDRDGAPPVVLVNESMARLWWGGENPVGKRIKQGFPQDDVPFREIVGVVGDVRQEGLDSPARPEMFMPAAQMPTEAMTVLLRTAGDPMELVRPAEAAVHAVDPDQPVSRVEPLERYFAESLARRNFTTLMLSIFGALALVLAATGIYGVVSYGVAERRREIGIRTALGARPADLVRLIVGQALRLAAGGLVIGAAAAFGLTRLLASLLYRVTPWDPITFSGVAALLTAVVLAACALPARRATRIAPTSVMRAE